MSSPRALILPSRARAPALMAAAERILRAQALGARAVGSQALASKGARKPAWSTAEAILGQRRLQRDVGRISGALPDSSRAVKGAGRLRLTSALAKPCRHVSSPGLRRLVLQGSSSVAMSRELSCLALLPAPFRPLVGPVSCAAHNRGTSDVPAGRGTRGTTGTEGAIDPERATDALDLEEAKGAVASGGRTGADAFEFEGVTGPFPFAVRPALPLRALALGAFAVAAACLAHQQLPARAIAQRPAAGATTAVTTAASPAQPRPTAGTPGVPQTGGAAAGVPVSPPFISRPRAAAPQALATMASTFPGAIQEEAFIRAVAAELSILGFRRSSVIAVVNTCRDEVCRPIVNLIDQAFGMSFNISGLGGSVNCGKTGLKAAMSHSPVFPCDVDGTPRERYVFFAFPHISIGETGEVGSILRRGRGLPSSACGALIAVQRDIANGGALGDDSNDEEYANLRKKVAAKMEKVPPGGPTLVETTKAALTAATEDLERLISLTVDPATADYSVVTGVQIHSGDNIPGEPFQVSRTCDYIAKGTIYAVVRGRRYNITVNAVDGQLVSAIEWDTATP